MTPVNELQGKRLQFTTDSPIGGTAYTHTRLQVWAAVTAAQCISRDAEAKKLCPFIPDTARRPCDVISR